MMTVANRFPMLTQYRAGTIGGVNTLKIEVNVLGMGLSIGIKDIP